MSDISLIWFTIEDRHVTASRTQVRDLSLSLGLPMDVLSRQSMLSAFKRAASLSVSYRDEQGVEWTLTATYHKASSESLAAHVQRQDGLKVAEFKFFQSRRSREGIQKGTHVVRSVLRANLRPADSTAAQEWLSRAKATFAAIQEDAPCTAIRRQARASIMSAATPVIGRESMYFCYDDEIDVALRTREFLRRTTLVCEFALLGIDDLSDHTVLAASADTYLESLLERPLERMQTCVDGGQRPSASQYPAWRQLMIETRRLHARHERRLTLRLPRADVALARADRLMSQLPRPASLPRVNNG